MTETAFTMSNQAPAIDALKPGVMHGGDKIGAVQILACNDRQVELRTPGELGWGGAMVGLVPIIWCAAAWVMCLKEHLLQQRLGGCLALSAIALVSAFLMNASMATIWTFDRARRRITRRVGFIAFRHNARRLAGLKLESTRASALSDVHLRMTLVDATGEEEFEIADWKRREIDRAQVEALAAAIRRCMDWTASDATAA